MGEYQAQDCEQNIWCLVIGHFNNLIEVKVRTQLNNCDVKVELVIPKLGFGNIMVKKILNYFLSKKLYIFQNHKYEICN